MGNESNTQPGAEISAACSRDNRFIMSLSPRSPERVPAFKHVFIQSTVQTCLFAPSAAGCWSDLRLFQSFDNLAIITMISFQKQTQVNSFWTSRCCRSKPAVTVYGQSSPSESRNAEPEGNDIIRDVSGRARYGLPTMQHDTLFHSHSLFIHYIWLHWIGSNMDDTL